MAFNGSGTHVRVHDWTTDLANTIPVTASRMDAEHDDISTSLTNTICRDGQSTATARIPFALGVSAAAGSASAAAYAPANDLNTGLYFPALDQWGLAAGGAATLSSTATALTATGTLSVSGAVTMASTLAVAGTVAATGDITHHGQPIVPVGTVLDYAGAAEPNGWLFCYGQAISRATYSALFTALGVVYGVGDGATTFNLPDLRGRVIAGQDDMGGTSANRLTNQSGGLDGDVLGAAGGAETHTLTTAQLPVVTPAGTISAMQLQWDGPTSRTQLGVTTNGNPAFIYWTGDTPTNTTSVTPTFTGTSFGSGNAHNNVQPSIVLNKMIFTGVYS